MQMDVKRQIQKGEGERPIDEERKAWSHAISNSEDVPCTKWPPARRSEGVEKRCGLSVTRTGDVEGGGGGGGGSERGAFFCFCARYLRYSFVRTKGRMRAFVDGAPQHTRR